MNERIKELAEQAGMHYRETSDEFCEANKDGVPFEMLERFAELVRQDERDKCAKLLDDFSNTRMVPAKDTWRYGVMMAANCVRDKK